MNKVIITGRLGADPVEHDGENGKFVTYTLANTEWSKNGETTNWIDVVAFGSSSEFALKNLVKGQKIILEGKLKWIKKNEILSLNMWEGDHIFLERLILGKPYFELSLIYGGSMGDTLIEIIEDRLVIDVPICE